MNKLYVLLYGQQNYIRMRKIKISVIPKSILFSPNISKNHFDYIIDTISAAKTKYGLVYLNDPDYLGEMQKEIEMVIRVKHMVGNY
jgi:hypothetical protein